MADEHQTNAIIATAVLDSFRGHSDHKLDPEEAKINCETHPCRARRCWASDHASRSFL